MVFTLVICTYKRSGVIVGLMNSIVQQTLYPDEILIIDGSPDDLTKDIFESSEYQNLKYVKVKPEERGLTKQRNVGVSKTSVKSEIICFLDDDTILDPNYFQELLHTYTHYPQALGVGGYISNDLDWEKVPEGYKPKLNDYYNDGFKTKEGSRFMLRRLLGLDSDVHCGMMPEFSHGRSVSFLPPSGKVYQVDQLMGGVSSFRKDIFKKISFSTYFEGYGLYEDADFTLRLSKLGSLYINTKALVGHYHEESGRPNKYEYGKMVVINGWYVWRVKYNNPSFKSKLKWHLITNLLLLIRFTNVFTTADKKQAWQEVIGRISGYITLFINKPEIKDQ